MRTGARSRRARRSNRRRVVFDRGVAQCRGTATRRWHSTAVCRPPPVIADPRGFQRTVPTFPAPSRQRRTMSARGRHVKREQARVALRIHVDYTVPRWLPRRAAAKTSTPLSGLSPSDCDPCSEKPQMSSRRRGAMSDPRVASEIRIQTSRDRNPCRRPTTRCCARRRRYSSDGVHRRGRIWTRFARASIESRSPSNCRKNTISQPNLPQQPADRQKHAASARQPQKPEDLFHARMAMLSLARRAAAALPSRRRAAAAWPSRPPIG